MFRSSSPPSRLYLGTVGVVPRHDIKRYLEWAPITEDVEGALRTHLEERLALPKAPSSDADAGALALDVFVSGHQLGEAYAVDLDDLPLPLAWRPRVEVSARLYRVKGREPVTTFHVSRTLGWPDYLRRFFSWRATLGMKTLFGAEDIKQLLDEALIDLLERVRART